MRNPSPQEDPRVSRGLAAGAAAVTQIAATRYARDPTRARADVELASSVVSAFMVSEPCVWKEQPRVSESQASALLTR